LVPAMDVLLTSVHIPARSSTKIRNALPFALEEDLAEDIENLHFAVGERQENNSLPVAVVSNEKMTGWLTTLNDAGIEPVIVAAENHGLSRIPGTMSLLVDGETIMFNDGGNADFVMQDVKPSDVLVVAGQLGESDNEREGGSGHLLVFCSAAEDEALSHDWLALRSELSSVDVNVLPDGVLPKLAVTVAAGHGINLLQGEYGQKTEYGPMLRPWKFAAALLLGLAMVGLLTKGLAYYKLTQDEVALQSQFVSEYRQIRPNDTREIIDPVATVNSLRQGANASGVPQVFLPSLRELGAAIAANSDAKIEVISYRAGIIDLRLTVPDVATLDSIQKAVTASGRFQASIQSTDQVADKINGRMQIREAGS
jgi:general secretion pathway protein L